ncbi:MAG: DUF5103 domain-containing protein [Saprospiraceae bacterium]|nr:DUF5103 domain-containing protein [Saprospiraceae bacterium]
MPMNRMLTFLCALAFSDVHAQTPNGLALLDSLVQSVKFHPAGAPLAFPAVDLKSADHALVLAFDHLGPELVDYVYTIEHCDHDWKRSVMMEQDYLHGFLEDRIVEIENSQGTRTPYTHYTLRLPNQNIRWLLSGNYLLKVYDNSGSERRLVLVRRFCVLESRFAVQPQMVSVVRVDRLFTHQELDFTVKHKNIRIVNPQYDVAAYVLQNGRWDTAKGPLRPNILRNEEMVFDFQDSLVFPAGKEWRFFNLRTFDFQGENVKSIVERFDHFEATLVTDETRAGRPYILRADINGHFIIENQTPGRNLLQCEYANVLFSIRRDFPYEDEDVYVFGELSNWQVHPRFRMTYLPEAEAYVLETPLKQGYYNYQYLVVNRDTGAVDEEGLEGNWHAAGNAYQVLVYYRPFGERYDRLFGYGSANSLDRR